MRHLVKDDYWKFQSRNVTEMFDYQKTEEAKGGDMRQIMYNSL